MSASTSDPWDAPGVLDTPNLPAVRADGFHLGTDGATPDSGDVEVATGVLHDLVLDIDVLDASARGLSMHLQEQIGLAVRAMRAERAERLGERPPGTSDVAPLVRRLAHAADVLDYVASQFKDAAAAARDHITDEALSTGGDRLVIPDGDTEIVVAPTVKKVNRVEVDPVARAVGRLLAGEYAATIADSGLEALGIDADTPRDAVAVEAYAAGARDGFGSVQDYGTVSWRVTDVNNLKRTLMAAAEDDLAGLVERAVTKTEEVGESLKVTRETFKKSRRG